GDLVSQVTRASTSVPLNLAEGSGRTGRDRTYHYRIAYSSAREASTGIALLKTFGRVDVDAAARAQALLDRTRAMIWRLMHPRGR
ncbi:MAG: four helix bundle protein, partial [Deltaproteobacteria bacterium]|nr:four helix bundle protein [Deltaproteobacteria bacterium]